MRLAALFALAFGLTGQTRPVAVIAHRGEHLRHPENTLPAYRAAVELGADFFEVDVRTTADGKLVLIHNPTVDATTNGRGEVARMTLAEIRALDAGVRRGAEFAGTRVPTLDEVMEYARGRAGIYLDCKQVAPRALVEAIERNRMAARVVLYGSPAFLRQVLGLRSGLKAMPEAVDPPTLRELIASLRLRVAAFDARDWNEPTIAVARAAGLDIYVDRLGPADTPEQWQRAIDQGATGIQTDRPGELVRYLRAKGYRAESSAGAR